MNQEDFTDFFSKLLLETDKTEDSPDLFSMHNSNPSSDPPTDSPVTSAPTSDQDQSPSQDQAEPPFEEAVPLEDELANLLDDID